MTIAIATVGYPPSDPRSWSGTSRSITAALDSLAAPYDAIGPVAPALHFAGRAFSALTRRADRRVNWEVEPRLVRAITAKLARSLPTSTDAVITLAWMPYGELTRQTPTYYWGDATLAQRVDAAPMWSGLSARTRGRIEAVEGDALRQLAGVIMPSRWAADDVVDRYGLPRDQVHVIPFGANLSDPGPVEHELRLPAIRLLVVGIEWRRKGVDRAVRIVDILRDLGHHATLDVVGVLPPDRTWHRPYVTYHGFLRREVPAQAARLQALYASSDLFLLPTRNDPAPIVLAEAAAYSLPALATAVGGVPERVADGESGVLMSPEHNERDWADTVLATVSDPAGYLRMCARSRLLFEERFGWRRAVQELLTIVGAAPSSAT